MMEAKIYVHSQVDISMPKENDKLGATIIVVETCPKEPGRDKNLRNIPIGRLFCSTHRIGVVLFGDLIGIEQGEIECPEHATCTLKRHAIWQWHKAEVYQLGQRPHLPICEESMVIDIRKFSSDVVVISAFHYTHGTKEYRKSDRSHE